MPITTLFRYHRDSPLRDAPLDMLELELEEARKRKQDLLREIEPHLLHIERPENLKFKAFKLSPNASRRTKQRWRAHQGGRCNSKCRFCARNVVAWSPANCNQAKSRLIRIRTMVADAKTLEEAECFNQNQEMLRETEKELERLLERLEALFENYGGRGVDLACNIDAHQTAVDILRGKKAFCPRCLDTLLRVYPAQERVRWAKKALDQNLCCVKCSIDSALDGGRNTDPEVSCTCSVQRLVREGCGCGAFVPRPAGMPLERFYDEAPAPVDPQTTSLDNLDEPGMLGTNPCRELKMNQFDTLMDRYRSKEWVPLGKNHRKDPPAVDHGESEQTQPQPETPGKVLGWEVAQNYGKVAKKVARNIAEVEIYDKAMIPGMMVWHRYHHRSAILLTETGPGFWTIEMKNGETENEVPVSILTPVRPNVLIRSWARICNILVGGKELNPGLGMVFGVLGAAVILSLSWFVCQPLARVVAALLL